MPLLTANISARLAALFRQGFADRIHLVPFEIHVGRVLMAWYLWEALPFTPPDFTSQPLPEGLGQWIDFTWIARQDAFFTALWCARIGILLYAVGVAAPLGLVAFLVQDISLNTLTSSQGIHGHGGSLNALLALALLAGHLYHAARHRAWRSLLFAGADSGQAALRGARCMLAGTYVVAGLSKVYYGGWDWWMRAECFVIQMRKAQDEMIATWTVPPLSSAARACGDFIEARPAFMVPMLAAALLMELGGFLACTTRVRALLLGVGLVAFHKMNEWLMGLPFPGNTQALMILFIMPASWLVLSGKALGLRIPFQAPSLIAHSPAGPAWFTLLQAPVLSIVCAGLLFWRGDWYPFSNFPMYSILPPGTHSLYATDLAGHPLPFDALGIDAPTLKKMINGELRALKKNGTVKRMSDLSEEHWKAAATTVVNRIRESWDSPVLRETSFQLHLKAYAAGDSKVTVTTMPIGTFPGRPGQAGAPRSP